MNDITIQSRLQSLGIEQKTNKGAESQTEKPDAPGFNEVLKKAISEVSGLEKEADEAVQDLISGGETNIHEAMIALQKADISFKVLMEVRDKIISAYKEVMRMQV